MNSLLTIATLSALLSTLVISSVFGSLTVLRDKSPPMGTRVMTCISEYDGGALVWNYNLGWSAFPTYYEAENLGDTEFRYAPPSANHTNDGILDVRWSDGNWTIASSADKAMGPVLDTRWEGFQDVRFDPTDNYRHVDKAKLEADGAVVFSFRGKIGANLLLCGTQEHHMSYWFITIGSEKTTSVIERCTDGVPPVSKWSSPSSFKCETLTTHNHTVSPVSEEEWRTFVLKWNSKEKTISVFNQTEKLLHLNVSNWIAIRDLYVRSTENGWFRFHFYDYSYTTEEHERLLSPDRYEPEGNFCKEMLVGLCSECQLVINAVDEQGKSLKELSVIDPQSPAVYGLPTWQFVKLQRDLKSYSFERRIRLEVRTRLRRNDDNQSPLWAVASIQECHSAGVTRYSTITPKQNEPNIHYVYSNPFITCQKLSYNGSFVTLSQASSETHLNDSSLCPEGKVGPNCAMNCSDISEDNDCKRLYICQGTSCECSRGFSDGDCTTPCSSGKYGFGCKTPCGKCADGNCKPVTGHCLRDKCAFSNCLPPICNECITAPSVESVSGTGTRVSLEVHRFGTTATSIIFQLKVSYIMN